jgi:hypothetical protein
MTLKIVVSAPGRASLREKKKREKEKKKEKGKGEKGTDAFLARPEPAKCVCPLFYISVSVSLRPLGALGGLGGAGGSGVLGSVPSLRTETEP